MPEFKETLEEQLKHDLQFPDEKKTNAELVAHFGVSERTIRRRRAHLRSNAPVVQLPPNAVQTKGKVSRFTPGEGWDSVEYKIEPDVDEVLRLEQVTEPLTKYPPKQHCGKHPSNGSTFVIALSDLQTGKTDELGGTEQLSKRLASVFTQIEYYLEEGPQYEEIILADTGDILEGFGNTVQQQQTNDLSLTDQIRYAQRVVVEAIRRFSVYAPRFTYVCVPSNHCAVRTGTGSKNRSNAPNDDWGLLIQDNIKEALEHHPGFEHVTFIQPSKWEEAVTYTTVDGTVIGFAHGHQWNPGKAGDWLAKMTVGRRSNMQNSDLLLHGHHHSFAISLVGAGQHVICAPTIDSGSSWFSNTTGLSSPASMLTFEVASNTSEKWTLWTP